MPHLSSKDGGCFIPCSDKGANFRLYLQLLVLDGLMATGLEPYLEAANLIQHKLYYDESSLEVVIQLLCSYTTQSHKFLENIVCLASVFLKMLERYSKKADYMFVRKKKPQRKAKAKVKGIEGAGEDAEVDLEVGQEEEAEFDAMEDRRADTYAEHKFEFQKFQAVRESFPYHMVYAYLVVCCAQLARTSPLQRFARESVLLTLMTYLADHEQFTDPEQLKRVVRLLHRVAVNANAESLFYKVSMALICVIKHVSVTLTPCALITVGSGLYPRHTQFNSRQS